VDRLQNIKVNQSTHYYGCNCLSEENKEYTRSTVSSSAAINHQQNKCRQWHEISLAHTAQM